MLALVLVGMMIRMGIPLAAALAVYFRGGPLADAGFLYYLVVFYPVTLTVGDVSLLARVRARTRRMFPRQRISSGELWILAEVSRTRSRFRPSFISRGGALESSASCWVSKLTKFMVLELVAAALMLLVFLTLAKRIRGGGPPKGLFWNFFEVMLVFIRDEVARPSIGKHDADKFLPFLWNMFFFILFCNLLGILPWAGSPTGALTVTAALAGITFCAVVGTGMQKFGVGGFFKSLVPHMELPKAMAILLIPMIFVIELAGLLIRHVVLAVRLLANMFAGHLVLAVILGFIAACGELLFLSLVGDYHGERRGLGRAYLVGVVRGLSSGLYIHVFVGTIYRHGSPSALGWNGACRKNHFRGDEFRVQVSEDCVVGSRCVRAGDSGVRCG